MTPEIEQACERLEQCIPACGNSECLACGILSHDLRAIIARVRELEKLIETAPEHFGVFCNDVLWHAFPRRDEAGFVVGNCEIKPVRILRLPAPVAPVTPPAAEEM